jgi:integrase
LGAGLLGELGVDVVDGGVDVVDGGRWPAAAWARLGTVADPAVRLEQRHAVGAPKSKRSYRTVPLADKVVQALARHVELHGVGDHGLVLHGPTGRAVAQARFGYVWRTMRRRAGLPKARIHDSRQTFASTLLSRGVSVAAAAEYLGHTPAVLLSTYAHLLPADHDRARQVSRRRSLRAGVSPVCHRAQSARRLRGADLDKHPQQYARYMFHPCTLRSG